LNTNLLDLLDRFILFTDYDTFLSIRLFIKHNPQKCPIVPYYMQLSNIEKLKHKRKRKKLYLEVESVKVKVIFFIDIEIS